MNILGFRDFQELKSTLEDVISKLRQIKESIHLFVYLLAIHSTTPTSVFFALGIIRSDLQGHAGKIQAALVIDFPDDNVNGFDVVIEGINGLLPNLDLINMAFAVSGSEAIIVKLHTQVSISLSCCDWVCQ